MTPVGHKEIHFEDVIEAHLIGDGWRAVDRTGFDIEQGLHVGELLAFIEETQPKAWASVVSRHGGEEAARERLVARLVSELDKRDTVDVLRHGIKEVNVQFALLYPRPASTLNPEAAHLYAANRCGVVRQLRYEEVSDNSIDLALLVNGIPVATAELKNPITGQTHEHALRQYERDRDPVNVTLGRRCMVHFAVDPDWVFFTTRLAGTKGTRWFPFNRGSEPDGSGGKGNYPDPECGHRTAYLWRDVMCGSGMPGWRSCSGSYTCSRRSRGAPR